MHNPLLDTSQLPQFSQVRPEHIEPAIDQILAENRAKVGKLLVRNTPFTWENLMQPLEEMDDRLSQAWSIVGHLNAAVNSEPLRKAYNNCLPKLSEYATEMGQNTELYQAVKAIAESDQFKQLFPAQQKVITNELRDFQLAGVHLEEAAKKRYAELQQQLAKLTTKFEENLLDATQGWTKLISDETELAGLPAHAIAAAKEAAEQRNLQGWLLTLEQPSYLAVITYADLRQLREEVYTAYATRSSDQGPNAGKWDNTEVMSQILTARKQLAQILGYQNYAELSLVPKMAKSTNEVIHFLNELALASMKRARQEFSELQQFVKEKYGIDEIMTWDIAYYSEKLSQDRYAISQEDLRPYFPEDQVLQGLFTIVNKLFGIAIKEVKGVDVWHPDVRFFEIYTPDGRLRGQFYLDLYARANKRSGAWMDECRVRRRVNDHTQTPIAFLTCNFNRPVGNNPALFAHDDVLTLFHEFGHGLHHLLTTIDYADVSGINGVPWDAVELPSQFLENWCWQKPALNLITKHYQTQEPLPDDLYQKMYRAKNFQSAMQMVRQLEFALFDFHLHIYFNEHEDNQVQRFLNEIRQQICVIPVPEFNRFQHSFSHIFAGGYAAGYYSYKWAEVLASDAFSKFEENGIFDEATGKLFLENILEQGGSEDPMKLFIAFRGREPSVQALLQQNGIS
jgi:oligopeptidase A